jgi:hypothetical protein
MVPHTPPKQPFSGFIDMEKQARISNASKNGSIEAMRESAESIDGILSGIYAALHTRNDIASEILDLLMIGAARAQILTEDLTNLKRPTLVRSN